MKRVVVYRLGLLSCAALALCLGGASVSFAQTPKKASVNAEEIRKQAREYAKTQAELIPEAEFKTDSSSSKGMFTDTPAPFAPESVSALNNFIKLGGKLFYMGERSGLYGWFVIKEGQIQMVYVTADAKTVMIGGVFTNMGESVTTEQITKLSQKNKEIEDVLNGAAVQQREIVAAGSTTGGAASLAGGAFVIPSEDSFKGKTIGSLLPVMPASPGERLLMDLKSSAHAMAGTNEKAQIYMVIDPRCGHCKATWRELVPAIRENKISVSLIPVTMGDSTSDETRYVANLLNSKNPVEAWDKYVNGDKSMLDGAPDQAQVRALFSNRSIIDRWNIMATPYLAYRAKTGQIKIVQGRPERMAVVLGDLLE